MHGYRVDTKITKNSICAPPPPIICISRIKNNVFDSILDITSHNFIKISNADLTLAFQIRGKKNNNA